MREVKQNQQISNAIEVIQKRKDLEKKVIVTQSDEKKVETSKTKVFIFGTGWKFARNNTKDKEGNNCVVAYVGRREPLVVFIRPGIDRTLNDTGTELTRLRNKKKRTRASVSKELEYLNNMKAVLISKVRFNKFSQSGMQGTEKPPVKPTGKKEGQKK